MAVRILQSETVHPGERPATDREQLLHRLATESARRGFRIAYDLLGDRVDAEDAVQEALARACESYGSLREPLAAEAWFFRVLVNVCMRVLRRRRVLGMVRALWPAGDRRVLDEELDAGILTDAEDPASLAADELLVQRAEVTRLLRALDSLPGKQRAALVLRYGHDLSVPEVAEMLGVGGGTAKTHLVRGLRRLRSVMRSKK